jgi:hypothetical protein
MQRLSKQQHSKQQHIKQKKQHVSILFLNPVFYPYRDILGTKQRTYQKPES